MEHSINSTSNNTLNTRSGIVNFSDLSIFLLFISTVIQAYFGYARDASVLFKAVISLFCWIPVFLTLTRLHEFNSYPKYAKYMIIGLLSLTIISISHTLGWGKVYSGNKVIVVFSNMYSTLDLIGPIFCLSILNTHDLQYLKRITFWMIIISLFLLMFHFYVSVSSYFLTYICIFAPIFLPYLKSRDRLFLLLGMSLSLFCIFGGGRQAILIFSFACFAYLISFLNKKTLIFIISILLFILPFVLIAYSVYHVSIFELFQDESSLDISYSSDNEALNSDNRTFLWLEMYEDFSSQDSWIQLFGKGCVAYYDSAFFRTYHRFGIEVPVLQWILQCGVLYFVLYALLVFYAIYRYHKYGKNKLSIIAQILVAAFFFNSFISNLIGCSIMQLGFWALIGMSFNKKILEMTDDQLTTILSNTRQ